MCKAQRIKIILSTWFVHSIDKTMPLLAQCWICEGLLSGFFFIYHASRLIYENISYYILTRANIYTIYPEKRLLKQLADPTIILYVCDHHCPWYNSLFFSTFSLKWWGDVLFKNPVVSRLMNLFFFKRGANYSKRFSLLDLNLLKFARRVLLWRNIVIFTAILLPQTDMQC